jgi:hypothetical protein
MSARGGAARPRWRRRWLIGACGVAALAGACALPMDYEVDVGNRIAILVPAERLATVDVEAVARHVHESFDPERLEVQVGIERTREVGPDGEAVERSIARIELFALGDDIDVDAIWDDLVEHYPALEGGRVEDEALAATVHGTLGGRLSRGFLDDVIDEHGVEEARRRVLDDLRSQGIDADDAEVEITDDVDESGHRRRQVKVRVEAERHDHD